MYEKKKNIDWKRREQIEEDIFKIRNLSDYLKHYKKVYKEMLDLYNFDITLYQAEYPYSDYDDSDLKYAIKLCNLYLSKFKNK